MAGYDRDEVSMLSDTHPTSISIPMSSMESYETGNNVVGSTRSLRTVGRAPLVHRDMNRQDKVDENWKKSVAICCLVGIFLDPLFFLLLFVQQDNKCIAKHRIMTKTIVVFRCLTDSMYLLIKFLKSRREPEPESRDDHPTRTKYMLNYFVLDFFVVLPLPQIMVLWVLPKYLRSSGAGANLAKNVIIAAVLIQYIPRWFRFLPFIGALIFKTEWATFLINLFAFVLSGHVIGSWWYLFGLQRVHQCLRGACNVTDFKSECIQRFIDCGDVNARGFGNNSNWTSWRKNKNAIACFSGIVLNMESLN